MVRQFCPKQFFAACCSLRFAGLSACTYLVALPAMKSIDHCLTTSKKAGRSWMDGEADRLSPCTAKAKNKSSIKSRENLQELPKFVVLVRLIMRVRA